MIEPKELYANSSKIGWISKEFMYNAQGMLRKAKIVENLNNAYTLSKVISKSLSSRTLNEELGNKDEIGLFKVFCDFYEHIIDEVAIISAFELFAKSRLLKKQYLIHEIESPKNVKNKQKKLPIHRKTYQTSLKKNIIYKFSNRSISASLLLSKNYCSKYGLSEVCMDRLRVFNDTRNLVHLQYLNVYGLKREDIEAIIELKQTMEKYT